MKKLKYFIFAIILSLFFIQNTSASSIETYVDYLNYNNWSLLNGDWNSFISGNRNITFSYSLDAVIEDKWVYNSVVLCSDSSFSGGVIPSAYSGYIRNINYEHTNYKCNYKNSNYTGGYVVLINFQTFIGAESGGEFSGAITVWQDVNASLQLIDFVVDSSNYVVSTNYSSDTLINQNSQIINQNNTIINQNTNINNSINNVNDSINNSNVDDPSSAINSFKNNLATNGVITQLVTLPVTLFTNVLNSVNGTCSSYNLGSLFGTDLILPCISISNYIGSTLWSVIDVLISGFFVYAMSRKFIKVFENLSSMKEGDVIGD